MLKGPSRTLFLLLVWGGHDISDPIQTLKSKNCTTLKFFCYLHSCNILRGYSQFCKSFNRISQTISITDRTQKCAVTQQSGRGSNFWETMTKRFWPIMLKAISYTYHMAALLLSRSFCHDLKKMDPTQNSAFRQHYWEDILRYCMAKGIIICVWQTPFSRGFSTTRDKIYWFIN